MRKHIITPGKLSVLAVFLLICSLASAQNPFSGEPVGQVAQSGSGFAVTQGGEKQGSNSNEEPQKGAKIKENGSQDFLFEKFLAQNVDYDELMSLLPGIPQELRVKLLDKIRFAIVQENRNDLKPLMDGLVRAVATKPQLSKDNMLGIPMRPGKLEISALFIKKYGTIVRSDSSRFKANLDTVSVDVVPDKDRPGRVLATFSGTTPSGQLPQAPVGGTITTNGTTGLISTDDGSWIKVVYQSNGTYKISTDKLPLSVTAKYID